MEGDYRPAVGVILINGEGKVFIARRSKPRPGGGSWQMPQGGIDEADHGDIAAAACRELYEETHISAVEVLGVSPGWTHYEYPQPSPFKEIGQKHRWVLMRYRGDGSEIDFTLDPELEFSEYKWVSPQEAVALAVDFKKEPYRQAFSWFAEMFS